MSGIALRVWKNIIGIFAMLSCDNQFQCSEVSFVYVALDRMTTLFHSDITSQLEQSSRLEVPVECKIHSTSTSCVLH
jgi:hypothetical protein